MRLIALCPETAFPSCAGLAFAYHLGSFQLAHFAAQRLNFVNRLVSSCEANSNWFLGRVNVRTWNLSSWGKRHEPRLHRIGLNLHTPCLLFEWQVWQEAAGVIDGQMHAAVYYILRYTLGDQEL